ncbi:hypothetical protein ACI2JA_19725 [Alkalihalobacillus sp. NPDC078783]
MDEEIQAYAEYYTSVEAQNVAEDIFQDSFGKPQSLDEVII